MCGIGGIVSKNGKPNREITKLMGDTMIERGPDNLGFSKTENIELVHRRLSIIDLSSNSNQPTEDNNIILTFNGEIYNYREVIEKMRYNFNEKVKNSDTLFLFEMIKMEGLEKTLTKIKGMFAFSVYYKNEKKLFLIRDHLGKKPLYYSVHENQMLFCSDIRPLNKLIKNKTIDEYSIEHYLYDGAMPQPHTIYNEIKQVIPGSYIEFDTETFDMTEKSYFQWETSPNIHSNEKDVIKNVKRLLEKSIKRRLQSDVKIGSFLSGGIDSTVISYLMASNSSSKINTYTIGFKNDMNNELKIAREIASYLKTNHNEFNIDFNPSEIIEELISYLGEPLSDASILPSYLICKHIKKDVTVALSGDGGDEIFYGYPAFGIGYRAEKSKKNKLKYFITKSLNKVKLLNSEYPYLQEFKSMSDFQRIDRFIGFSEIEKKKIFSSTINLKDNQTEDNNLDNSYHSTIPNRLSKLYIKGRLRNSYLVKIDRMSMKNSLEVRSPFLDIDLIQYMLNVSDSVKLNNGRTLKHLTKKIASEKIPKKIIELPKKGFSVPLDSLIRNEIKSMVKSSFKNYSGKLLNKKLISNLLDSHLTQKKNVGQQIWNIFVLLKWAELNNEKL